MGVDAEMLVRNVPASLVTPEWLKEASWRLCQSVGARHFMVDPDEGRAAISPTESWDEPKPPAGSVYEQDGPDVLAEPGECLLRVHLAGRYYGVGYERGDLLTYCAVAEWLEVNIPGCVVWYGGDSSGVCAKPWPAEARAELRKHLYSKAGRDYFNYRSGWGDPSHGKMKPAACSICPGGEYCGSQYGSGGGGGYAAWRCAGCGVSTETRDHGKTWAKPADR